MDMPGRFLRLLAVATAGMAFAAGANAQTYEWRFEQIYSNVDGFIQFAVVYDQSGNTNNMDSIAGIDFQSVSDSAEHAHDPGFPQDYVFPTNLPSTQTAGRRFLIATQAFADLKIITPDYVVTNQFIPQVAGTLALSKGRDNIDIVAWPKTFSLPNDGVNARYRDGSARPNVATNFAGQSASVPPGATPPLPATTASVEYYYADWDYYFVTAFPDEQAALDGGAFGGVWKRTGESFKVWPNSAAVLSPTCRFFSTSFAPKSSHFYTPFAAECATVKTNPNWQFEAIAFYLAVADASGNCAAGTVPLYRLYNNGKGGAPNHRYTTSKGVFNQMATLGWVAEGNGPDTVFACVPA